MRTTTTFALGLAVLACGPAAAQEERVIPSQELVMVPTTPVGKSISILLEGTDKELEFLNVVQGMLQDLLRAATLRTETTLIPESMAYGGRVVTPGPIRREIVLKMDSDVAEPPMQVGISIADLDKPEDERVVKVLFYNPEDPRPFKEGLREYLSQTLNLDIPSNGDSVPAPAMPPAVSSQPAQAEATPAPVPAPVDSGPSRRPQVELTFKAASVREEEALSAIAAFVRDFLQRAQVRAGAPVYPARIHVGAEWDAAELFMEVRMSIDSGQAPARLTTFRYDPDSPEYFEEEVARYLGQALNLDSASR